MSPTRAAVVLLVVGAVLLPGPAYALAYGEYTVATGQQVIGTDGQEGSETGAVAGPPAGFVPGLAASAAGLLCLVAGGANLFRGLDGDSRERGRR
jgi:hypothetical protein